MGATKKIYLALGSNLGDRAANLAEAVRKLAECQVRVLRCSRLYETEPMGLRAQPWFLNQVVEAETDLFPLQLLARTLEIERELGRRRTLPNAPRTLDIDILLFGGFVVDTPRLRIPHPRMNDRRFVLEPLAELAPDLRHPVTRRTIRDNLAATLSQRVRILG